MPNFHVTTDDLNATATATDGVSADLARDNSTPAAGSQPSHAAVAAMASAIGALREQQAGHTAEFANGMRTSATEYRATDSGNADGIAGTL